MSKLKDSKNCKKAYEENQYCQHVPDKMKRRMSDMETFTKYDGGKPKHSLLPAGIMNGVAKVMGFGAGKYEKDNWKKCQQMSSYYDACHRHLEQFWGGVDLDEESGLHHIDHAMCNLVFLKWLIENEEGTDDRSRQTGEASKDGKGATEGVENVGVRSIWKRLFKNKDR